MHGALPTAVWAESGELFTFGDGQNGRLGPGVQQNEGVPRLVEAFSGKKVVGASAGSNHTAAWIEAGELFTELFTFGEGFFGQLGHGGDEYEDVPRLVEALAGKKVVGAAAGLEHTAVWTTEWELFTFGTGDLGALGLGNEEDECVPTLVETLLNA
jgi:alpha-tubulin suppressor-like RCC1 family protein